MKTNNTLLSVRLGPTETYALDEIASARGCSRANAARLAIGIGAEFARRGHTINMTRLVLQVEKIAATVDSQHTRDHGDCSDELTSVAMECVERFHV